MSDTKSDPVFYYIYQTPLEATLSDVRSLVVLLALMGVGVWLDSSAMQWFGFVLGALWIIGRATNSANKSRMTPQQAADRLYECFGVVARAKQ